MSWVLHLVLCVGIVAPAISGALAAMIAAFNGAPLGENFLLFFAGHALGNITFTPIALIFANGGILAQLRKAGGRAVSEGLGLLTLVAMVSVFVFGQQSHPLLFLPMLPVILVTFRVGPVGAALAVGLIALIGGGLTLAGSGPIQLISESLGPNLQFFQLYLAATVLSVLPVAADLQNRNRLRRWR
jgi:integral membrane sensor domain MASE1